ncbi:MAG: type II toxin-antitoxin system VapC family toxin [Magnetococcales bacterium]|nr:type II toxin-antitoxin system VapC family toxin [Magnetococcales bacterium]
MIIDTNIIIYSVRPTSVLLHVWMLEQMPFYSVISRVESLGYNRLTSADRFALEAVLSCMSILYPTPETFEKAIRLRQQRRISLGDALIAATALEHHQILATANVEDFAWIQGLTVINPLVQHG